METTLARPVALRPRLRPFGLPSGWRVAPVVVALWSVPAVVALGQVYLQQVLTAQPMDWRHALWTTLPNWYLWALLTPLIVVVARRFRPGRAAWPVLAGAHTAGALGLLGLHALGSVAVFAIAGLPAEASWAVFWTHYTIRFHVNVVAYALAVAAVWVVDNRRRALDRERQEAALRAELAEAQLQALKMQLRPHFLFNALHAVGATMRKGDADAAVTMLTQLGDLLRFTLEHDGAQEVPLSRELAVLERYLALEGVRFGDRLTARVEADADVRDARVPSWVLQPLVENALKHAVAPYPGPATLAVRARRDGDAVVLEVEDSGPGLGRGASRAPSTGVGLANTRARLAALYGDRARLDLLDGAEGGLLARVTLPHAPR
ncbi:MAG: histidine kinase [Rubricoccaceae bacterium]|nr:histidine kinase [Rubricoccaceae bacterium]